MNRVTRLMAIAVAAVSVSAALSADAFAAPRIVPRAACQPGDKPDTGLQGQIPMSDRLLGRAQEGYFCNLRVVGTHEGRVFGSLDQYGSCLYVPDETWIGAGTNAVPHAGFGTGTGSGVRVLDMSDPEHPKQTALLTSPMALAPDESLTVNARRGLLVMDSTFESTLDVYDLKPDCRKPKLIGSFNMAPAMGHAGWFSPDGNTYWMTNAFGKSGASIFPVDLTDPAKPKLLGQFRADQEGGGSGHNGWVSDDGKTTYACQIGQDLKTNRVLVYRSPTGATTAEKALVTSFPLDGSACQNMQSVSYGGRPFLIANSEYTVGRFLQKGPSLCQQQKDNPTSFSTPQIFDLSDDAKPKLVSSLMLEVDDPANCSKTAADGGDPTPTAGTGIPGEVYDTHFCRPDRLHDPTILACARFLSGLEVYDIRDPYNPKELAYFRPGSVGMQALTNPDWGATPQTVDDVAAPPVVSAARGEIWFGSYFTGIRVVRLPKSIYPFAGSLTCANDYYFDQYNPGLCPRGAPSKRTCYSRRSVTVHVRGLRGRRVRALTVSVNGKVTRRLRGDRRKVGVSFRREIRKRVTVKIVARVAGGRRVIDRRSYALCVPRGR